MGPDVVNKLFPAGAMLAAVLFAYAPVAIAGAPYESTMGLVQKIFYFHVPSWFAMFLCTFICGVASAVFLFSRRRGADALAAAAAELVVLFGAMGLITGPLWARRAWGVWWQWDAKLTTALVLWLIFVAYLLLRRYGGPGSERLAAGLALFGMANVPFVYWSVHIWRTVHPLTTVVPTLPAPMAGPLWLSVAAFLTLSLILLALRARLERLRRELDGAYLALDEQT
jgi:heme exporter protein C